MYFRVEPGGLGVRMRLNSESSRTVGKSKEEEKRLERGDRETRGDASKGRRGELLGRTICSGFDDARDTREEYVRE